MPSEARDLPEGTKPLVLDLKILALLLQARVFLAQTRFMDFLFKNEFMEMESRDQRVVDRLVELMGKMGEHPQAPINQLGDGSQTKAYYRLFQSDALEDDAILRAHRDQTLRRMNEHNRVLLIQDTSTANFSSHWRAAGIGDLGGGCSEKLGGFGLFMHTALVTTIEGMPLGLWDQRIWSRKQSQANVDHPLWGETRKWFLPVQALEELQEEIRAQVITVSDRESDIMEYLLCCRRQPGLSFVVRGRHLRRIEGNGFKVSLLQHLQEQETRLEYETQVPTPQNTKLAREAKKERKRKEKPGAGIRRWTPERRTAQLEVKAARVGLQVQGHLREEAQGADTLEVNAVLVSERDAEKIKEPVQWLLLTDLPVNTVEEIREVIEIYKKRWTIEIFFKVLKSGCRIEDCRLETAERLARFILLKSIVACRLLALSRCGRETPMANAKTILEKEEIEVLRKKYKAPPRQKLDISTVTIWIARLGGYLARRADPPPGPLVIWRGWDRLQAMVEGYRLSA